jgi:hypothetical protein
MKVYLSLFALFIFINTYCQTNKAFPAMQKVYIDTSYLRCIFGYETPSSTLINITCDQLPRKDYWYCDPTETGEITIKLARFRNDKLKDSFDILYSPGVSDDPVFIISNKNGKTIGSVNCLEFYITNSGIIYTAGHTNNMFNKRQKFQLTPDTLIEIKQPYYYVGLKSKTLSPLTLYANKTGNDIVAQLPKDYQIEILLCDEGYNDSDMQFLVKTEFGLVGWLRLKSNYEYETPIEGLFYRGD